MLPVIRARWLYKKPSRIIRAHVSCASNFDFVDASIFLQTIMSIPFGAAASVLKASDPVPEDAISVKGPDFEQPLSLDAFLRSYERIGFQATSFGKAINIVDAMVGRAYANDEYNACLYVQVEEVEAI